MIDGWYPGAAKKASPNFNQRPTTEVSLLVIHNISLPLGEFANGYIAQLFCNEIDCSAHESFQSLQGVEVSAHFLIDRTGAITQFVSCDDRAWHAGLSSFAGRKNCNDFSIGIELEGTDFTPFNDDQYRSLIVLTKDIQQRYPTISTDRIVGHEDIAPGRKTDPGPCFDWDRYKSEINTL